ncbi:homeobox, partial [Basidiobolus meristosporus CBS 931.73]
STSKRKRANSEQLRILKQVFDYTFFPSTELRAELSRVLGMTPRAVQVWFQNKRQSWKS